MTGSLQAVLTGWRSMIDTIEIRTIEDINEDVTPAARPDHKRIGFLVLAAATGGS
jgi:hypothetical protein